MSLKKIKGRSESTLLLSQPVSFVHYKDKANKRNHQIYLQLFLI